MKRSHARWVFATLGMGLAASAVFRVQIRSESVNAAPALGIPAYHSSAPTPDRLPKTLDPGQFSDPAVRNAYALAGKIRGVLYQQPCYCYCDRSQGHGSLLDCFTSKHGSLCDICLKEAVYSYSETRKGKTPAQIREGIERGDWQATDLTPHDYSKKPR